MSLLWHFWKWWPTSLLWWLWSWLPHVLFAPTTQKSTRRYDMGQDVTCSAWWCALVIFRKLDMWYVLQNCSLDPLFNIATTTNADNCAETHHNYYQRDSVHPLYPMEWFMMIEMRRMRDSWNKMLLLGVYHGCKCNRGQLQLQSCYVYNSTWLLTLGQYKADRNSGHRCSTPLSMKCCIIWSDSCRT